MDAPEYLERFYESSALASFEKARHRALMGRLFGALRGKPNRLAVLEEDAHDVTRFLRRDRGVVSVPVQAIVGTLDRLRDFDRDFMPRHSKSRYRWMRIDYAQQLGMTMPPIDLIKVDDQYYVSDGHHRLSVARLHGQQFIDANVVELIPNAPRSYESSPIAVSDLRQGSSGLCLPAAHPC